MTESQLQNGELLVETVMQRTNGQTVQISPPFPVRRRSRFYGNRHMWQVTVPNLKRQLGRTLQKGAAFDDLITAAVFLELRARIIWWLTCATLAFVQFRAPVGGLLRHTGAASFFQQRASCAERSVTE